MDHTPTAVWRDKPEGVHMLPWKPLEMGFIPLSVVASTGAQSNGTKGMHAKV